MIATVSGAELCRHQTDAIDKDGLVIVCGDDQLSRGHAREKRKGNQREKELRRLPEMAFHDNSPARKLLSCGWTRQPRGHPPQD